MRLATALGIALASLTMAAYAQPETRVFVRHGGGPAAEIDANHDGWITRAEASAAADRIFAELDSNHDGRLTDADHGNIGEDFDVSIEGPEGAGGENCETTTAPLEGSADGAQQRRVTVICLTEAQHAGGQHERHVVVRRGEAPRAANDGEAERHVERHVVIMNGGQGEWVQRDGDAMAPMPPMPPHPPMLMMLFANSEEADRNGDGALSLEEFRAQHLRFFDASDANGDGRVRFTMPPMPPIPPMPPMPPAPPAPPSPPAR